MKLKKAALLLLMLLTVCCLAACEEPEPGKDAVLVVEQFVNKENGMIYVTTTMNWEQGKLVSMRFEQTFDTQDHAATAYLIREKELGESGRLTLEDNILGYNISIEPWADKTYAQMLEAMEKDKDWQVVEELSGELDEFGELEAEPAADEK